MIEQRLGEVRQLTNAPHGHILTNVNVWSPDSRYVYYDVRSDESGSVFDGSRIERVDLESARVDTIYESLHGAKCGVVTCSPRDGRAVFILGPEHPTDDWQYCAWHRRGVMVDPESPGDAIALDACDIVPPFTPGALRGGSHVHVFHSDANLVSFTYEDHVLSQPGLPAGADRNQRNVGVSVLGRSVTVPRSHPRNHDGSAFSVLVTTTHNQPVPGSDQIQRAYEDAWIGQQGYVHLDGRLQRHALAFLGDCVAKSGEVITELFIVDLPDQLDLQGDGPLQGTATRRPFPPRGYSQRRLTHTEQRKAPGIRGPRFWPRSHPDGSKIAILLPDEQGNAQLHLVETQTGSIRQLTALPFPITSAFTWSPDGRSIAFVANQAIMTVEVETGRVLQRTRILEPGPRPEACVFSPNGHWIAFVQQVSSARETWNQIFAVSIREDL